MNLKVIIYDEDNFEFVDGKVLTLEKNPDAIEMSSINGNFKRYIYEYRYSAEILSGNKIELDPTTMKKIAKYNKERENIKLQKQIDDKKIILESLNKTINLKNNKLKQLLELSKEFIDSDLDNIEDMFKNEEIENKEMLEDEQI